ncbi:MAG: carboxypeptidase-like regulatory domain-containing protein [Polyangiales bacterium]
MSTSTAPQAKVTHLSVPLLAAQLEADEGLPLKVALFAGGACLESQQIELSDEGCAIARFTLREAPADLRVVVGPADAPDADLEKLQTIVRSVSLRGASGGEVRLPAITIAEAYWRRWRRWCRTFTVRGRVVCADGSPVPGARVCAFDTDRWWWWQSRQQVGCAVTDADGAFKLTFRWCCGWLPIWWARMRRWELDPLMVDTIGKLLKQHGIALRAAPSPTPNLAMFEALAATDPRAPVAVPDTLDLGALTSLRPRLLAKLPGSQALAEARLWPWYTWAPWWDCSPDLTFRVTQKCQNEDREIVRESLFDTRWNVPTELEVTLVAGPEACCVEDDDTPQGNCVVISKVCDDLLSSIGGNPGAAATPVGYLSPGMIASAGDRPYAGVVPVQGMFGSAAQADYYEFEWATAPAGPFAAMPASAAGGFDRVYWGPALGGGPVGFHAASFPFTIMSGRLVVESREHFEANNDPLSWGTTRFWVGSRDLLFRWLTSNTFADGTYYLRVRTHRAMADALITSEVLPLCGLRQENLLAITLDNGTSDLEPAADVIDVRIQGASAGPCSNVNASDGGSLEIDVVAYDVDGHLASYSLIATYGLDLAVDLLSLPGAVLTPVPLGAVPAADYVGPDYGAVRSPPQSAAGPTWHGGGLRLTIPDARHAFPETCCYQIELRAYKRSVVSCNHTFSLQKLSYYSLTVVV